MNVAPGGDDAPVREPHRPLTDYYGSESDRRGWVRGIFDSAAGDYDRVERLMAFGTGAWYRGQALARAGLRQGMRVVDVGTGTGLVAAEAVRLCGDPRLVTGVDPSPGMLAHARIPEGVRLLEGRAESIPLPDGCADFVSMGYALRHLSDLSAAFREFRRVLAPGGRVCVLEITRPEGRLATLLLKAYMRGLVPALSRVVSRSPDMPRLMRYYWDTIEACVPPQRVMETLSAAGFTGVSRHVEARLFSEYTATAP